MYWEGGYGKEWAERSPGRPSLEFGSSDPLRGRALSEENERAHFTDEHATVMNIHSGCWGPSF
ncbi:hypothetical protein HJFPF1_01769 [Paramyrothecium foliicola]|nr:hypothetical protein HJFPF1_01769 [Paramyrothecium foliicola]